MASKRQLSELLEEKQEPFLLDVYLLENGWSSKRLERLSSQRFTRRREAAVGFLRSVLAKLVHGKKPFSMESFRKGTKWDSKPFDSGRLSVFDCFSSINSGELEGDQQWRCVEMDESKQLSPVSVLGFHNHRIFKEENQSSTSSFDSPREAPAVSHYSRPNKREIQEKQLLLDCLREAAERIHKQQQQQGCLCPEEAAAKFIQEKVLSWQRLNGDVSSLSNLLSSDMSEFSKGWIHFRPEVRELSDEIEAAMFEEIVDGIVLEILASEKFSSSLNQSNS